MAGFRAPVDLSGILGLYEPATPPEDVAEAMKQAQVPDELKYPEPVRLGLGPVRWSTSQALVPVERVCHDVNGYYRELGVDWRATRKELREAYVACQGQSSARLTYIFKQLLNPEVREAYDKMAAGDVFLDDYTTDELKRRAHEEAGKRSMMGQSVSAGDVMDEWGYALLGQEEWEALDNVRAMRNDRSRKAARRWDYSYYAWRTPSFFPDEDRMRQWQELLASAASAQGVAPELAIGTTMSEAPYILGSVADQPVVFFSSEQEPDASIAAKVVETFFDSPSHSPKDR